MGEKHNTEIMPLCRFYILFSPFLRKKGRGGNQDGRVKIEKKNARKFRGILRVIFGVLRSFSQSRFLATGKYLGGAVSGFSWILGLSGLSESN